MSPELDRKLCEKYPEIFANRNAPVNETAMCWGFDVGDGWYPLIDMVCARLMSRVNMLRYQCAEWYEGEKLEKAKQDLAEAEKAIPVASQVKEKFGGLRFYVESATDEQYNYIDFIESMSYRVCEDCGTMKDTMTYSCGWMRTLCPDHADQQYGRDNAEHFRKTRCR